MRNGGRDDGVTFMRAPARRPAPVVRDPLLQWATGLPTTQREVYVGWLVEAHKDADLDAAMKQAGSRHVAITHGAGNTVEHWRVETADLFVLADGIQPIGEMQHTTERYGIAFAWHQNRSYLRARVLLRSLLVVGYAQPLMLTLKGTITGDCIDGLLRQYDVLDAYAAARGRAAPFYAFSIPFGPGAEVARGATQTKVVTPPVAQIPAPIDEAYLRTHWIAKAAWVARCEALMEETLAWSVRRSVALATGQEQDEGEAVG